MGKKLTTILTMIIGLTVGKLAIRSFFSNVQDAPTSKMEQLIYAELKDEKRFTERFKNRDTNNAYQDGRQLASSGLRRLDTPDLLLRARVLSQVLEQADEETCAGIASGGPTAEKLFIAAFENLPEDAQKDWAHIAAAAVRAELDGKTYVEPTSSAVEDGYTELSEKLSPSEKETLKKISMGGIMAKSAKPGEICAAGRAIYKQLSQISGRSQDVVAHALVAEAN